MPECPLLSTLRLSRVAQISQRIQIKNKCPLQRTKMNRLGLRRILFRSLSGFHAIKLNGNILALVQSSSCPLSLSQSACTLSHSCHSELNLNIGDDEDEDGGLDSRGSYPNSYHWESSESNRQIDSLYSVSRYLSFLK